MGMPGNGQGRARQIQGRILPFNGQNSPISRGHVAIDGRVFGTATSFHLCGAMTTRRLLRPTQTRHGHSDQRQRDDENVDEMSQSESPISTGLYFLELGPFDFFVLQRRDVFALKDRAVHLRSLDADCPRGLCTPTARLDETDCC